VAGGGAGVWFETAGPRDLPVEGKVVFLRGLRGRRMTVPGGALWSAGCRLAIGLTLVSCILF